MYRVRKWEVCPRPLAPLNAFIKSLLSVLSHRAIYVLHKTNMAETWVMSLVLFEVS